MIPVPNLRPDGGFYDGNNNNNNSRRRRCPEMRDSFIDPYAKETTTKINEERKRKRREEEEEEANDERTRRSSNKEAEMRMLVSKLEDLKGNHPPLEIPEYKAAYKVRTLHKFF